LGIRMSMGMGCDKSGPGVVRLECFVGVSNACVRRCVVGNELGENLNPEEMRRLKRNWMRGAFLYCEKSSIQEGGVWDMRQNPRRRRSIGSPVNCPMKTASM
jgi:hypothetical protein